MGSPESLSCEEVGEEAGCVEVQQSLAQSTEVCKSMTQRPTMKRIQTLCTLACLLIVTSVAVARDLKQGMSGADVKQWQLFLKTRNFDLPADGQFGPVTKRATITFQRKWGLYADGLVGRQTLRKAKELGYGSTSRGTTSSKPRGGSGAVGQPVSKEVERIVIYNSVMYVSLREFDYKTIKVLEKTPVRRAKTPGDIAYYFGLKYQSKNRDGGSTVKSKYFACDGGGNVVLMVDAKDYGYRG